MTIRTLWDNFSTQYFCIFLLLSKDWVLAFKKVIILWQFVSYVISSITILVSTITTLCDRFSTHFYSFFLFFYFFKHCFVIHLNIISNFLVMKNSIEENLNLWYQYRQLCLQKLSISAELIIKKHVCDTYGINYK